MLAERHFLHFLQKIGENLQFGNQLKALDVSITRQIVIVISDNVDYALWGDYHKKQKIIRTPPKMYQIRN